MWFKNHNSMLASLLKKNCSQWNTYCLAWVSSEVHSWSYHISTEDHSLQTWGNSVWEAWEMPSHWPLTFLPWCLTITAAFVHWLLMLQFISVLSSWCIQILVISWHVWVGCWGVNVGVFMLYTCRCVLACVHLVSLAITLHLGYWDNISHWTWISAIQLVWLTNNL